MAVKQRKNNYKNIFKKTVDGRTKLESLCYTSICLGKIKEDIAQWINLVDSMNVDIESERETINLKPSPRQVSSINHFSTAINDFTNSLIKVELDSNKTYTTSEAALTYLGQVAKSSLGVSSAIVLFPFKLINNTLRGVSKLKVDGKFIIKDLSFEKLKTYDLDDSINDFLSTADSLKTEIGITVGEEEAREYLIKSLEKQSSERDFILREVMPKDVEFKEKVQTLYPEYFMNRKPEERSELLNTLNSKDKKCFNYTVRRGFKKGRVVPICAKVSGLSVKDISLYNNGYDNFRASRFNAKLICKGLGFSGYKKIEKKEYSFYRGAYRLQNLNLVSRDELPSFWSTMKSIECKY